MNSRLKQWYPVVLALLGFGMSAAVFRQLPDTMEVHWDIHGNPNGWMPRAVGAAFLPALILVLGLALRFIPRIDPRAENYERFGTAYEVIIAAVLVMLLAAHGIMQSRRGDYALFFRKAAVEITFEGERYLVVPQQAILALVRE